MKSEFLNLGIIEEIVEPLRAEGIVEPTPIQRESIPVALQGKDIIAQAQTGTGKTFAFMLPILQKINKNQKDVQALILAPTRELALQITTEAKKIAKGLDVNVLAVYGGQDVEKQIHKLKGGMHVVIATPGRLLDHLRRGTMHLKAVNQLVLDEADQMLTMGFLEEVEYIIKKTPQNRQLMLYSATIPKGIRALTNRYMKNPVEIRIHSNKVTLDEIKQLVVETTDRHKQEALMHMIKQENPFLAIVFCRTKRRVKTLSDALIEKGFSCDELHGDMTQAKREKVMKEFRNAKLQILVATDVAARGIDVEGITHVFNYDIPQDVEGYIHRIGRTGRAGDKGMAITFAAPKDRDSLAMIERGINQKIVKITFKPEGRVESIEETFEREAKKREERKNKDNKFKDNQRKNGDKNSAKGRKTESKRYDSNKNDKNDSKGNRSGNYGKGRENAGPNSRKGSSRRGNR
ncbi:DEAD/DEAH box helicase [Alkaliphilus oremlandii]|uniref:RNA helicase n=1 Tax=Alkaliphilus oremlandii (strain OhILAs) TaxID=350688 RepID=A8MJ90_ALKOO|nr:DEAD/DEAH box helicase [Alkaliphilus oremlandii]ABW19872.1 DEAD/DEAH box helicase domain protein [Alkaliphilus oremlandii OhILAs]